MKNSVCPKCSSNEIIRIPGDNGFPNSRGNLIFLGWTIFSTVLVTRFVCGNCGYSEEWVDESKDDLEKLKKKFGTRVHKKNKGN
jgi:ribosomal protein S27AE